MRRAKFVFGLKFCLFAWPFIAIPQVRTLARSLPYPKLDESIYGDELFDPLADAVTVKGYVPLLVRGEKARLGLDQVRKKQSNGHAAYDCVW